MKRLFIDVETTGVDCKLNAIHQIAGYIEIDGVIKETFNIKTRPHKDAIIEVSALEVGHVTEEELMEYPDPKIGFNQFLTMLDKYVNKFNKSDKMFFIGYNGNFDKNFIHEFFERHKTVVRSSFFSYIWGNIIDVMSEASVHLQYERINMVNFKLMTVVKKLNIPIEVEKLHDALYDIFLTREIFYKIECDKPKVLSVTGSETLDSLLAPTKIPDVKPKVKALKKINDLSFEIWFGKHSGQTIETILSTDASYIVWLHDNTIQGIVVDKAIMDVALSNAEEQKNNRNNNNVSAPYVKKTRGSSSDSIPEETPDSALDDIFDDDLPF